MLKREFYDPFSDGSRPVYKWGQTVESYQWGEPMPPILLAIIDLIEAEFGERPNHSLLHLYEGSQHFVEAHQDKQEGAGAHGANSIAAGTTIFSISLGVERTFRLLTRSLEVVWESKLAAGSLFALTAAANKELVHDVPKEASSDVRLAIVFRTIKKSSSIPGHVTTQEEKFDPLPQVLPTFSLVQHNLVCVFVFFAF